VVLSFQQIVRRGDQGSNIRPVYVGADNNDETKPLDAAKVHVFQNILTEAGRKY